MTTIFEHKVNALLKRYEERVEKEAWVIFKRINDCRHQEPYLVEYVGMEPFMAEPCGRTSTGGTHMCSRANDNFRQARAQARRDISIT